jgi:hypothetical protein
VFAGLTTFGQGIPDPGTDPMDSAQVKDSTVSIVNRKQAIIFKVPDTEKPGMIDIFLGLSYCKAEENNKRLD